jgi:GNAT superfamily N-acetyltransferase
MDREMLHQEIETMNEELTIEEWNDSHSRWAELFACIDSQQQVPWATSYADWHLSTHMLVAYQGAQIVGFLRFVTQHIGSDAEHETVNFNGVALTEAKVLAFGVIPAQQRQGIGRALQEAALWHAERLGCYQVRSHSSGSNTANHALKLAMGFGVHPIVRGDDTGGVYFVMPLHPAITAANRRSP